MKNLSRHLPAGLLVKAIKVEPSGVVMTARAMAEGTFCPACGTITRRVHSHYLRTLADLPWHDRRVTWRLQVRRFRCGSCEQRIFAERLPDIVARKGRRTVRLAKAQASIGLALGGEPGARLSYKLSMPVSGDTLLRLIRGLMPQACRIMWRFAGRIYVSAAKPPHRRDRHSLPSVHAAQTA